MARAFWFLLYTIHWHIQLYFPILIHKILSSNLIIFQDFQSMLMFQCNQHRLYNRIMLCKFQNHFLFLKIFFCLVHCIWVANHSHDFSLKKFVAFHQLIDKSNWTNHWPFLYKILILCSWTIILQDYLIIIYLETKIASFNQVLLIEMNNLKQIQLKHHLSKKTSILALAIEFQNLYLCLHFFHI